MRLRQARKDAHKTQQLVATEAGMSVAGYRKLEAGGVRRPAATTIHGVSRSVGVDPHEVDEFAEVLAGYEVVSGTQAAYQTAALAHDVTQVVAPILAPDVEETRRRYHAGEFEGDFREDGALRHEIKGLIERQQRLIREQQEVAEKLAMFGEQVAAQEKTKSQAK